MKPFPFSLSFMVLLLISFSSAVAQPYLWQDMSRPSGAFTLKAAQRAAAYKAWKLDPALLRAYLQTVPDEKQVPVHRSGFMLDLPMPDGTFSSFRLVYSPVMEKGLADAYPQITTWAGTGIDDPSATLRCDITPFGFHAMIISESGTVFIDPVDMDHPFEYISYDKKDAIRQGFAMECLVDEACHAGDHEHLHALKGTLNVEGQLRTYRLALACTGEYAAFYGGTVAGALAGMVTTMNRVNGVYERELGIHMNLIENDTLLIYTNASSDPYSNNNGSTMLSQNQSNINNVIGSQNYDIGHVFSTGGGGIANLGCVCSTSNKARGVTGSSAPIGDAFDIDYVAHEMGHQFGGSHTFNSTAGSCGGGNRVASAAYEPGSASTIMGYAGICGNQNLQNNSDDYFHTRSFDEIINYTRNGNGNSCPVITYNGNNAPLLSIPGDFNIPLSTPFRLEASATDPDGDPVTYCWEQFDLGPAGNWNNPSGNAPIFRSFLPVSTGTRLFPKLANILSNTFTIGEYLPTYARTLNFRCIVRDNVLSGCGITYNPTTVKVNVIATPGPFAVLTPNTTGITWTGNSTQTVTWSVNNSDLPPVSTSQVNVLLSADGGNTFPYILGSQVPNNGAFTFTVPDINTTTARVMVEAHGNIFFDINDKHFTITQSVGIPVTGLKEQISIYPNPADEAVNVVIKDEGNHRFRLSLLSVTGQIITSLVVDKTDLQDVFQIDLSSLEAGVYYLQVAGTQGIAVRKIVKSE